MENVQVKNPIRSEDVEEGVNRILVVETSHQDPIYDEKAPQTEWPSEVELSDEHPNQMKIIDQQNETLGNISLSHEQLMTILANKTEGGIVTLHLQNDDGVTAPVQLQIVPEDQVFQSFVPNESSPSMSDTVANDAEALIVEGESKITPVLQLSQQELQGLVNKDCKQPIKSIVFKQIKKIQEKSNCITANPNLQKLIRRKTYLDIGKHEIMEEVPSSKKSSAQYKCNRCNRGFTTSGNLKRHILNIHADSHGAQNIEQRSCDYCGKKYSRPDYLAQHIKAIHEQATKYQCEQCGKNFTQKGSMTRHVRAIHLNLRDFNCKHCEYRAMSYNDLKKHAAKSHFNRSRYECTICGHTSWSASIIKKHIINVHSENTKAQSRKCRYCGTMVNLSNESYSLHVAACKTMAYPTAGRGLGKNTGKRKIRKSVTDEMVNPDSEAESPSVSNISSNMNYDAIPWEELCQLDDDDDVDVCNSINGKVREKVGNIVDNMIDGYIRDLQD